MKKFSISRLFTLSLLSIVVISIAIGIYALVQMKEMMHIMNDMKEHPFQTSRSVRDAYIGIQQVWQKGHDTILHHQNKEELIRNHNDINQMHIQILEALDKVQKAYLGDPKDIIEIKESYQQLKIIIDRAFSEAQNNQYEQARMTLSSHEADQAFKKVDEKVRKIGTFAANKLDTFIQKALAINGLSFDGLLFLLSCEVVVALGVSFLVVRFLREQFGKIIELLEKTQRGDYSHYEGEIYKNEVGRFFNAINELITILAHNRDVTNQRDWIKDGINLLTKDLSGESDIGALSRKIITFICRYTQSGVGGMYIYETQSDILRLYGSFAMRERSELSNIFKKGEGLIGQVVLEREPIILTNISREQMVIHSAINTTPPVMVYAYPIYFQDSLVGAVEIGTSTPFSETQLEFINEALEMSGATLYSALQNEEVKRYLTLSQEANEQLQSKSQELYDANARLEEQQQALEEANAQMEEQQQQLLTSSEELRQKNEFLVRTQQEMDKKAQELELSNKYKSEFLANMSHELRTPLNSIILLSNLLGKNTNHHLTEDELKRIGIIHSSGNELLRLINDILDLSKIQSGKMTLLRDVIDSSHFCQNFAETFHDLAHEKGITFDVQDRLKQRFYGDKDKLSQIVRNLLSNAFKFTKEGGVILTLESLNEVPYSIRLSVQDSGIGIPADKKQLIFEAFAQVDGSISREFGGTGLGLSITKELVELMGGRISLSSEIGKGSQFSIDLVAHLVDTPLAHRSRTPDDRENVIEGDEVFLIIEDDVTFASYILAKIHANHAKGVIALTGQDALVLLEQYSCRGVFLDLTLPDMNGMEILRRIKADKTRHIPVFVISGKDKSSVDGNELEGFLQKPVKDEEIQKAIIHLSQYSFQDKKILCALNEHFDDVKHHIDTHATVFQARTLAELENYFSQSIGDVVIIEQNFDGQNCYELCKEIKQRFPSLPLIVYLHDDIAEEYSDRLKEYANSLIVSQSDVALERLGQEVEQFLQPQNRLKTYEENSCQDFSLSGKKVLVVDDDIRNVYILTAALEEKEAEVIGAKNGKEALQKLAHESVDLVIMDIMMPEMDGLEAIQVIRSHKEWKNLPIIAATAKAMSEDRKKCLDVGANDYISKPINLELLWGMIKTCLKL